MYPPRRTETTPRRTIDIDLDGEIVSMDWDKPTPPRKSDVIAWVKQKRTPNAPTPPPTR